MATIMIYFLHYLLRKGVVDYMKRILTILAFVCVLLVWTSTAYGADVEVITPYSLHKACIDNLDVAREQYMNKTVLIKGVVVSIGMSKYMTPNVVLSDQGSEAICVLPYVGIAYWNRSAQLADFKEGQTVIMSGRVHNMTRDRVVLKECKEVEP
jgi:hypothetical protein